jgi:sugar/nucleoside kinase (ribokinase family)
MIVCVGDLVTDVLAAVRGPIAPGSDTPASIRVCGGGQAANTASWLAAAGAPVTLVAAIGDDQAGRDRVAELAAAGVHVAAQICPGVSTGAVLVLTDHGDRTMITDRGANLLLSAESVDAALTDASWLHLSAYTLLGGQEVGRHALAQARARGITVSVDAASAQPLRDAGGPAFLSWVRPADVLFTNADEAAVLAGRGSAREQALALAEAVGGSAVVKLGARGAVWAFAKTGEVHVAHAPEVTAVDTTGAGDAFAAGLLAALAAGRDPATALQEAVQWGSRAVTSLGARPHIAG